MLEPRYSSPSPSVGGGPGGGSHHIHHRQHHHQQHLLEQHQQQQQQQQQHLHGLHHRHHHHHHHHSLDTAVDLSRKSGHRVSSEAEESEDEAPLDLKVRPSSAMSSSSTASNVVVASKPPLFPGFSNLPGPQQRAELLRIAEIYTSAAASNAAAATTGPPSNATPLPPASSRDSSQERDSDSCCQHCGANTNSADFVPSEHKEGSCSNGSIACGLCAKTFTLYSHYEAHKKCHQKLKQRQYPCQTCGKIFTSASNRNMHQRIHKGVRPFQCTPCGVFFRQKAHLQKHQKTQGHVQATELFEKKKGSKEATTTTVVATENEMEEMEEESSTRSSSSTGSPRVESTSSNLVGMSSNSPPLPQHPTSSTSPNEASGGRSRFKSSPKRKQAKPQYHHSSRSEDEDDDEEEDNDDHHKTTSTSSSSTSEEKMNSFVEYNDLTHGYDCRQCVFSSHELSVLKDHVREEHFSSKEETFRCGDCQITFSKEFNLRIHNRKHESGSQFLPCDHCEQVFKVPNKLIKHMEGVHSVCPTCGEKQEDKAGLVRHQEDSHGFCDKDGNSSNKGYHANMLQFANLNQTQSAEKRAAKMRKVDSLAEVIRQKQLMQNNSTHQTSALNGNNVAKSMNESIMKSLEQQQPRRRKNDMSAVRALLAKTPEPFPFMFKQSDPMQELLRKSDNNNVLQLSSLKLPPSIRLPTQPVAGLTPPSSPPPQHQSRHKIRGELTIVLNNGSEEDDDEETGLDLSTGSKKGGGGGSDENEVSTTTTSNVGQTHPRYLLPTFPFPFPGLLPPVVPSEMTEHLLKLSVPSSSSSSAAAAAAGMSNPYTVLSAMLGHNPYQPAFPGMFPATSSPSSAVAKNKEVMVTPMPPLPTASPALSENSGSKPFSCTYCRKDFGHLSSLESHVEHMHSGETKHACETCGKNFSSKSNLTAHKKIHSGERPFECAVCHKRFRQKAHLQKHETTHSSATPYQCTVCDKAFGHPSNLNTHMATHSNVRPFNCGDCGKSYKDSASFKRHRLGHTGERPYSCSLCPESLIDSKSLRRHRELAHPTAAPDPDLEDEDDDEDDGEIVDEEKAAETSGTGSSMDHSGSTEEGEVMANKSNTSTSAYSSFESQKEEVEEEEEEEEEAEDSS